MQDSTEFRPLPRGVYIAPFTLHGERYLYAVNDLGEHVGMRLVPLHSDFNPATDELWVMLDAKYPTLHDVSDRPPSLTLVAG